MMEFAQNPPLSNGTITSHTAMDLGGEDICYSGDEKIGEGRRWGIEKEMGLVAMAEGEWEEVSGGWRRGGRGMGRGWVAVGEGKQVHVGKKGLAWGREGKEKRIWSSVVRPMVDSSDLSR
ncbi:hypothetical protein CsSME_00022729 [Camellia sinensis var. sinensis]